MFFNSVKPKRNVTTSCPIAAALNGKSCRMAGVQGRSGKGCWCLGHMDHEGKLSTISFVSLLLQAQNEWGHKGWRGRGKKGEKGGGE